MGVIQFLDFIVDSSADSIVFAEFEGGPPLWVIDTRLFAGQPSLSIKRRTRVRATVTSIVLSGARYPGTTLPADFSIEIIEAPGDENQSASQEVTLGLAFGNASFDWSFAPVDTDPQTQTDPFLEWLNRRAPATASISISGTAVTFANADGLNFGPSTSATLSVLPGVLTIEDGEVCTGKVAGVSFTGSSVSVSALDPAHTDLVVQTSTLLSVPLPSPTPLGTLTAQAGFSMVTLHASETRQSATFSSADAATLYLFAVSTGITEVDARPLLINLTTANVHFDFDTAPPQISTAASGRIESAYLLSAGIGLRMRSPPDAGAASIAIAMSHSGVQWQAARGSVPLAGMVPPLGYAMTDA